MYRISFESLRDIGKIRKNNEDFVRIDTELQAFCVADGVGGEAAGEVASRMACDGVIAELKERRDEIRKFAQDSTPESRQSILKILQESVERTCAKIFLDAQSNPKHAGMSSTLEVALLVGNHVLTAHVGDSRTYLIRGSEVHQLTEDHKVGVQMVKQGVWTIDQAKRSSYSNTLTRAMGGQEFVEVDVGQVELMPHDRFLLCTDGLYEDLDSEEMLKLNQRGTPLKQSLQALQMRAYARGARDNLSGILFECAPEAVSARGEVDAENKLKTLKHVHLFRYLNYAELNKVLGMTRAIRVSSRGVLIREGDQGKEMFIILSGSVSVEKGGKEVAVLQAGKMVGEMSIIDQAPRSASVIAREATEVLAISRESFVAFMRKESQISVKVLWAMAVELNQNLRKTTEKLIGKPVITD